MLLTMEITVTEFKVKSHYRLRLIFVFFLQINHITIFFYNFFVNQQKLGAKINIKKNLKKNVNL